MSVCQQGKSIALSILFQYTYQYLEIYLAMANDIPINDDWLPNVLRDDNHFGHHHRLRLQKHGTPTQAKAEG